MENQDNQEKNKGGRPKSSLEELKDLKPDWYIDILDLYKEGGSDAEAKAIIYDIRGSFSNDLWDRWMKEEQEFSEAIKAGRMLSRAWWEASGRKNLTKNEFSYTGWYMNMKNRFGWRDRVDQTTNDKSISTPMFGTNPLNE